MKRLIGIVLVSIFVLTCAHVSAGIPHYMQFQGKATDINDTPLNGPHDLTFRIYDAETEGNLLWSETHSAVPVENGVFSVLLGGVTPLDLVFDNPYWISTEIETTNSTNEMPRIAITSVGYAYMAETISEWVIENRTSDPENPKSGQIWIRTDL